MGFVCRLVRLTALRVWAWGGMCKDVPGNVFTHAFGVEGMWAAGVQLCGNDKIKAGPKSRQR